MSDSTGSEPRNHEFTEITNTGAGIREHLRLRELQNVSLSVSADLGHATMLVREVLELERGSVVPLDKLAGEMTDIFVNELPLAKGEVVVIGDALHVRVAEIIGQTERQDDVFRMEEADQEEEDEI